MIKYVLWRLVQFPLILAIIYLLTFALTWVVPGSPFEKSDRNDLTAQKELERDFHASNWQTFLAYYPLQALHGDFGHSMQYTDRTVLQIVNSGLPISVTLGIVGMTFALVGGVLIGVLAAVRRGGWFDFLGLGLAVIGISVPSFVIASGLLILFCVKLHWFSIGHWGRYEDLLLPGIALSLLPMAYVARLTRVSMLEVLQSDFVRTARAKGLSRSKIIWKHCFRHAMLPVVSYAGPAAAATLTGSFVVETVFNLQGLGQHFVNSVLNKDQTMILGIGMVYSAILLAFNLFVDLAYVFVDPRIDLQART